MKTFFVNLPLRYIEAEPASLELFLASGIAPELAMDAQALDRLPDSWHQDLAGRISQAGLPAALHLPFDDLYPGSSDPWIREASARRLTRALEVARVYDPVLMVAHPRFSASLLFDNAGAWVERSADNWADILASWPQRPPLYLENIAEADPAPLLDLLQALDQVMGDSRTGLCLDVGHWFSFSKGRELDNLEEWIEAAAPRLGHLHLHDNDGTWDHHLGLGLGDIPWDLFFSLLKKHGLSPTVTFEPHTREAFEQSMLFVGSNPEFFEPLGIRPPALPRP